MGKSIVAVNAGPRLKWNTNTLITEAARGAESMFNPEAKLKRHETVFPQECRKAFEMGAALAE